MVACVHDYYTVLLHGIDMPGNRNASKTIAAMHTQ